ncbi:hypothetical protein BDV41DRAFT_543239 [Aspergillus transmontanensis]|uniref:Uncharacterized protein n=1 Tax=Aspergillus transmontanensis TaxID=1034304 RepID=A0A5N6VS11_9EURO|nr:hypothetical protein BDV41DRAFT_543239 [Aspergillus transmontanensis]
MHHYPPWNPDTPFPSIEATIDPVQMGYRRWISDSDYSETESECPSSVARGKSGSVSSGNEARPITELLRMDDTDTDEQSISGASEGEVDGITIIDEREIERPNGKTYQYLVKCWVSEEHMALFSELIRMS